MQSTRTDPAFLSPDRVVVISASIGAGHDGAAAELTRRLRRRGFAVERFDFLDLLPPGWGQSIKQMYAGQLAHAPASWGWLLSAAGRPAATRSAAWLSARAAGSRLLAAIGPGPAAVLSTYPLASQVLGRLRLTGRLAAPAVAVMTDPSVHPLCVAGGIDLHLSPNDDATTEVRTRFGLPVTSIAPVVDPAFRPGHGRDGLLAARRQHGLPPDARLALVVAGSWGVGDIETTVTDLAAATDAVPVVVCGRNTALRDRLAGTGRVIALGWVDDMPTLLRAADVVVHNAGGLTSLEALSSAAPVVSYRCLPGHGVANAAVLERTGLSAWPRTPAELAPVLRDALGGGLRSRQQAAFRGLGAAQEAADLIAAVARVPAAVAR